MHFFRVMRSLMNSFAIDAIDGTSPGATADGNRSQVSVAAHDGREWGTF